MLTFTTWRVFNTLRHQINLQKMLNHISHAFYSLSGFNLDAAQNHQVWMWYLKTLAGNDVIFLKFSPISAWTPQKKNKTCTFKVSEPFTVFHWVQLHKGPHSLFNILFYWESNFTFLLIISNPPIGFRLISFPLGSHFVSHHFSEYQPAVRWSITIRLLFYFLSKLFSWQYSSKHTSL